MALLGLNNTQVRLFRMTSLADAPKPGLVEPYLVPKLMKRRFESGPRAGFPGRACL